MASQLKLPAIAPMRTVTHEDATSGPCLVPDDETRLRSEGQSFKRSLLGGNFYLLNGINILQFVNLTAVWCAPVMLVD